MLDINLLLKNFMAIFISIKDWTNHNSGFLTSLSIIVMIIIYLFTAHKMKMSLIYSKREKILLYCNLMVNYLNTYGHKLEKEFDFQWLLYSSSSFKYLSDFEKFARITDITKKRSNKDKQFINNYCYQKEAFYTLKIQIENCMFSKKQKRIILEIINLFIEILSVLEHKYRIENDFDTNYEVSLLKNILKNNSVIIRQPNIDHYKEKYNHLLKSHKEEIDKLDLEISDKIIKFKNAIIKYEELKIKY